MNQTELKVSGAFSVCDDDVGYEYIITSSPSQENIIHEIVIIVG